MPEVSSNALTMEKMGDMCRVVIAELSQGRTTDQGAMYLLSTMKSAELAAQVKKHAGNE